MIVGYKLCLAVQGKPTLPTRSPPSSGTPLPAPNPLSALVPLPAPCSDL